ncbi:MAG TPA: phosphodiester glycosidase family protein [Solirubrobacterales bacterium]|nr:phosphodiester glycosidase family protein [Solirubrobacterales bacterium]
MSPRYELSRIRLADGSETTVYVVVHPRRTTRVRVTCFEEPRRLDHWCAANSRPEAIVAGFFVRDPWRPLGEVRVGGEVITHEPIAAPFGPTRSCLHVEPDGAVALAPRGEIADAPAGDLVQAGPRLVADERVVVDDGDPEGFSAAAGQFDSDITAERHPRCALGVNEEELFAVCCDGRRTGVDAGLDLAELARLLLSLGATDAINLDGGGSATLVHRGHLLNRPYSSVDQPGPESRPVVTALLFDSR